MAALRLGAPGGRRRAPAWQRAARGGQRAALAHAPAGGVARARRVAAPARAARRAPGSTARDAATAPCRRARAAVVPLAGVLGRPPRTRWRGQAGCAQVVVVPFEKVQSVRLRQGPVERRLGLATVHMDTAGGLAGAGGVSRRLEADSSCGGSPTSPGTARRLGAERRPPHGRPVYSAHMADGPRAVILAAGEGARMRSALPKVLHPLAGRAPSTTSSTRAAPSPAGPRSSSSGPNVPTSWRRWGSVPSASSRPSPAAPVTRSASVPERLREDGEVLVLSGDVPLVRAGDTRPTHRPPPPQPGRRHAADGDAGQPARAGRVYRDPETGRVVRTVEERDLPPGAMAPPEVNAGVYVFDGARLWPRLAASATTTRRASTTCPTCSRCSVATSRRCSSSTPTRRSASTTAASSPPPRRCCAPGPRPAHGPQASPSRTPRRRTSTPPCGSAATR